MTIRGHAFAKQLIEQHKYDSAENTHKKRSMSQELIRENTEAGITVLYTLENAKDTAPVSHS